MYVAIYPYSDAPVKISLAHLWRGEEGGGGNMSSQRVKHVIRFIIIIVSCHLFSCLQENLWILHKTLFGEAPVFGLIIPVEGKFYLRISTQVYTSKEDIAALVQVLKNFFKDNV